MIPVIGIVYTFRLLAFWFAQAGYVKGGGVDLYTVTFQVQIPLQLRVVGGEPFNLFFEAQDSS